jgi:hypothetical protein
LVVAIIAILNIIVGVLTAIIGMGFLGPVGGIFGLVNIIIGVGLFVGWKPFWYIGVIFTIIDLIISIFSVLLLIGIIPLIINIIILWYLFRPNVKAFFGVGGRPVDA